MSLSRTDSVRSSTSSATAAPPPSFVSSTTTLKPSPDTLLPTAPFLSRFRNNTSQTASRLEALGYAPWLATEASEAARGEPRRASVLAIHLAHVAHGEPTLKTCPECDRLGREESRARWAADDADPNPDKAWHQREKDVWEERKKMRKHMSQVDKRRKEQGLKGYYTDADDVSHLSPAHPGAAYVKPNTARGLGGLLAGLAVGGASC